MNRFWKHLFGRGLVSTIDNFGIAGDSPSHPELLDWLAGELLSRGWSRKQMIRLIVTSATYRQSSADRPDLAVRDPYNTLLARQSRIRVESEIIRDLALATSGLLDRSVGGPSIRPPMRSHLTDISRNREWKVSTGSDRYRRGMYILFRRATPYPTLVLFDSPDSSVSCAMRERSNSPLQALTLLNDPVFVECAAHSGFVLAQLGDVDVEAWIDQAFQTCLSRRPSPTERQRLVELYEDYQRQLKTADDGAAARLDRRTQVAGCCLERAGGSRARRAEPDEP